MTSNAVLQVSQQVLQSKLKKQLRELARRCVPTAGPAEVDQLVQVLQGMILNWLSRQKKETPEIFAKREHSIIKAFIEVRSTKKQFTLKVIPDAFFGPKRQKFLMALTKNTNPRPHFVKTKPQKD